MVFDSASVIRTLGSAAGAQQQHALSRGRHGSRAGEKSQSSQQNGRRKSASVNGYYAFMRALRRIVMADVAERGIKFSLPLFQSASKGLWAMAAVNPKSDLCDANCCLEDAVAEVAEGLCVSFFQRSCVCPR